MKKTAVAIAILAASAAHGSEEWAVFEGIGQWSGYAGLALSPAELEWVGGTSKRWKIWTSSQEGLYEDPEQACEVSVATRRPHDHGIWRIRNAAGDTNWSATGGWRGVVANMEHQTIWCEVYAHKNLDGSPMKSWQKRWVQSDWIKPVENIDSKCTLVPKDEPHMVRFVFDTTEDSAPVIFADHGNYDAPLDELPFVSSPYPDGPWDQAGDVYPERWCHPSGHAPYMEKCSVPIEWGNTVMGLSEGGLQHSGQVKYRVIGNNSGKVITEGHICFHGPAI